MMSREGCAEEQQIEIQFSAVELSRTVVPDQVQAAPPVLRRAVLLRGGNLMGVSVTHSALNCIFFFLRFAHKLAFKLDMLLCSQIKFGVLFIFVSPEFPGKY